MLPSGLPEHVSDDESLARFLTQSSHYTANRVKQDAFMPNRKDNTTSVFRHGAEPRDELVRIAAQALGSRPLRGAAILRAAEVRSAGLDLEATEPPARHANIVGWPIGEEDTSLSKALAKRIALQIARDATLLIM